MNTLAKVAIVTACALGVWEARLRLDGQEQTYRLDRDLWADAWNDNRERIHALGTRSIVLLGASRMRWDIDVDTLAQALGTEAPLQLAIDNHHPAPILDALAADPLFKGLVLFSVEDPGTFTTGYFEGPIGGNTSGLIRYAAARTPAQQATHLVSRVFERTLRFSSCGEAKLTNILHRQWGKATIDLPDRDPGIFPNAATSVVNRRDLQGLFLPSQPWFANGRFGNEPYLERMRRLTAEQPPKFHKLQGPEFTKFIERVAKAVAAIRARGGDVIFPRFPTDGQLRAVERELYPRTEYFDRLVREARATGFHFEDHAELQGFECPDGSHIAAHDRERLTRGLAKVLLKDGALVQSRGWSPATRSP